MSTDVSGGTSASILRVKVCMMGESLSAYIYRILFQRTMEEGWESMNW
jgi:hypothetical protein